MWGFLGYFFIAFSGLNVKLGAYCKAWMPGRQVNTFQGREADKSSPAVHGAKEQRQTMNLSILHKIAII